MYLRLSRCDVRSFARLRSTCAVVKSCTVPLLRVGILLNEVKVGATPVVIDEEIFEGSKEIPSEYFMHFANNDVDVESYIYSEQECMRGDRRQFPFVSHSGVLGLPMEWSRPRDM